MWREREREWESENWNPNRRREKDSFEICECTSTGNHKTYAYIRKPCSVCRIIHATAGKKEKKKTIHRNVRHPIRYCCWCVCFFFFFLLFLFLLYCILLACMAEHFQHGWFSLFCYYTTDTRTHEMPETIRKRENDTVSTEFGRMPSRLHLRPIQHSASLSAGIGAQMKFLRSFAQCACVVVWVWDLFFLVRHFFLFLYFIARWLCYGVPCAAAPRYTAYWSVHFRWMFL